MAQLRPLAGFQNQTDQRVLVTAHAVLMTLKVGAIDRARCYEVELAALAAGGAPNPPLVC